MEIIKGTQCLICLLFFILAIVLPVLRFPDLDYVFDIFKLFLNSSFRTFYSRNYELNTLCCISMSQMSTDMFYHYHNLVIHYCSRNSLSSGAPESLDRFLMGFVLLNLQFPVQCFVDHSLPFFFFFFWSLYCVPFFDLRLLIAPLISSNCSYLSNCFMNFFLSI